MASDPVRINKPARSAHAILREWIEVQTAQMDEVRVADLVAMALEEFRFDWDFHNALFEYAIPEMVPQMTARVFSRKRTFVKTGGGFAHKDIIDAEVARRLVLWYETARDSVRKPILRMTGEELDYAISRRQKTVSGHEKVIEFMTDLRAGIQNDETPEAVYTDAQIAKIFRKYYGQNNPT